MGKTYKNGYRSMSHSFNSLDNYKKDKQNIRRKDKQYIKDNFEMVVKGKSDDVEICKNSYDGTISRVKNAEKIGFTYNSSLTLDDVVKNICDCDGYKSIKCLGDYDKICFLIENYDVGEYGRELDKMKKQLIRRNKISIFEGINKFDDEYD